MLFLFLNIISYTYRNMIKNLTFLIFYKVMSSEFLLVVSVKAMASFFVYSDIFWPIYLENRDCFFFFLECNGSWTVMYDFGFLHFVWCESPIWVTNLRLICVNLVRESNLNHKLEADLCQFGSRVNSTWRRITESRKIEAKIVDDATWTPLLFEVVAERAYHLSTFWSQVDFCCSLEIRSAAQTRSADLVW